MTTKEKIIKVSGCHECQYTKNGEYNICLHPNFSDDVDSQDVRISIVKCKSKKTIHQDCPLDDADSHVNINTTVAHDCGYKLGLKDGTKNIRDKDIIERLEAVRCIVSTPCNGEEADCAYEELDVCISSIMADIKNAEGDGQKKC